VTLGSHQTTVGKSQVHLTPKWIIEALGPFDLDPCAANPRPWDCAFENYSKTQDGLSLPWSGVVWLNPPFDRYKVGLWVEKLAAHGDGIALLHARTETEWFKPCWRLASAILFLDKRIKFSRQDGSEQAANSGAPPVLVAFGERCAERLYDCGIGGAYLSSWTNVPATCQDLWRCQPSVRLRHQAVAHQAERLNSAADFGSGSAAAR
jgi:hypothetical protein